MFANYCFPVRKKPPYFLLNARSHSDMTLGIPPFTEHHRTIRSTSGSNPHISSRLKLAHDHSSGGFSRTKREKAQLPNQFIGHYGPSPTASSLRVATTPYKLLIVDLFLHHVINRSQKLSGYSDPGNLLSPSP